MPGDFFAIKNPAVGGGGKTYSRIAAYLQAEELPSLQQEPEAEMGVAIPQKSEHKVAPLASAAVQVVLSLAYLRDKEYLYCKEPPLE